MTKKEELTQQLNNIKAISTNEEWLVFVFAYYEKLTINEIAKILNKNKTEINILLDQILLKAVPILGTNVKLL